MLGYGVKEGVVGGLLLGGGSIDLGDEVQGSVYGSSFGWRGMAGVMEVGGVRWIGNHCQREHGRLTRRRGEEDGKEEDELGRSLVGLSKTAGMTHGMETCWW